MGFNTALIEKDRDLALACVEDGSDDALALLRPALGRIAKFKNADSFAALARICAALDHSDTWPDFDPIGYAMSQVHRDPWVATVAAQIMRQTRSISVASSISAAFAKGPTVALAPVGPPSGGKMPLLYEMAQAERSVQGLDHDVAACFTCRWSRMPADQAAVEIELFKSRAHGVPSPLLLAAAERHLISIGLPKATAKGTASRI